MYLVCVCVYAYVEGMEILAIFAVILTNDPVNLITVLFTTII